MSGFTILASALDACHAGIVVIPARNDGSKRPLGTWKHWQSQRPTAEQLHEWFDNGSAGGGVVCGAVPSQQLRR